MTSVHTPRILAVDDDPAILRLIARVLESEGFDVRTATDGEAALDLLDGNEGIDAVVLDLQMPRMDGRQFYERLRDGGHAMPVLVLSAYGAQKAAASLGAEAAMSKPFDIDLFVHRVRGLVTAASTR